MTELEIEILLENGVHYHVRKPDDRDACQRCGLDLRSLVHKRDGWDAKTHWREIIDSCQEQKSTYTGALDEGYRPELAAACKRFISTKEQAHDAN